MENGTKDLGMTMMELMNQGGWVMWALLVFSVVALATSLERAIVLRRDSVDTAPLVNGLQRTLLKRHSIKEALELVAGMRAPAARVVEAALRRFDRPAPRLEKSLERHALAEVRRLNRGLIILATIANVAPLLGFLGTVTGMMDSFDALWQHSIKNPGLVALGIKEALTTTAAGLVVAVPTQIAYNALTNKADRITHDIENVGNVLLEIREEVGDPTVSA